MDSIVQTKYFPEFEIVDLSVEYAGATGFVGKERYAIVTDLSEEDLLASFEQHIEPYKPYVIISREMYGAMNDTFLNDDRERKRGELYHDQFSFESLLLLVDETADPYKICESVYNIEFIISRMMELPDNIGPRIYDKYLLGLTTKEVAEKYNLSESGVRHSIFQAKPMLHDIFVECGVAS